MTAVFVPEPPPLLAINLTVYVPGVVYVWLGFRDVDVPVSPNVHAQLVGEFDEVSVKFTVNGATPLVGVAVKLAVGGATGTGIV